jgi:hypothetical protein
MLMQGTGWSNRSLVQQCRRGLLSITGGQSRVACLPLVAPPRRAFITPSTDTVGVHVYLHRGLWPASNTRYDRRKTTRAGGAACKHACAQGRTASLPATAHLFCVDMVLWRAVGPSQLGFLLTR